MGMSKEVQEAIEQIRNDVKWNNNEYLVDVVVSYIDKLQKELDKKDKVINKFAEDRLFFEGCRYLFNCFTKEDVIDYYYKLVEGEND